MRLVRFCLMVLILAVIAIGGLAIWVRSLYFAQMRTVDAALAEYPTITEVWLLTNEDVELEVEQIYFRIQGRPELTMEIDGPDGDDADKAELCRRLDEALRQQRPVELPDYAERHR